MIDRKFNDRVIVFVRTKSDCHRICMLLNMLGIKASELHGGLTQNQVYSYFLSNPLLNIILFLLINICLLLFFKQRIEKLNLFKDNVLDVLVATDLASRGLDIADVKTVINFAMPITFKSYIHRVGRTARAQNMGR